MRASHSAARSSWPYLLPAEGVDEGLQVLAPQRELEVHAFVRRVHGLGEQVVLQRVGGLLRRRRGWNGFETENV